MKNVREPDVLSKGGPILLGPSRHFGRDRQRMTSVPLAMVGSKAMRDHGREMATHFLLPKKPHVETGGQMKVVIVGAGWAGCAASISARKQWAEVVLLERTDMILGTGLVGGIMRNNGRFTAAEEMLAMSGGELFQLTDQNSLHRSIEFPGHPPYLAL